MAIIKPANYPITAYRNTEVNFQTVWTGVDWSGATSRFVVEKDNGSLLFGLNSGTPSTNGSVLIITPSTDSTIIVNLTEAETLSFSVNKYRYGLYITDSLGVANLYFNGEFKVRNV